MIIDEPPTDKDIELTTCPRPRNAKMDALIRIISGSPRYDVKHVATAIEEALKQRGRITHFAESNHLTHQKKQPRLLFLFIR